MSVNKYKPHVYVIPEDDADRQIADGFVLHHRVDTRQMQVINPAGGWPNVLNLLTTEYGPALSNSEHTHVVLLIDFDGDPEGRRKQVESRIQEAHRGRVFVIGPRNNPESFKQSVGMTYEEIGGSLAAECDSERLEIWTHDQMWHNDDERLRLVDIVRPFLFSNPTGI